MNKSCSRIVSSLIKALRRQLTRTLPTLLPLDSHGARNFSVRRTMRHFPYDTYNIRDLYFCSSPCYCVIFPSTYLCSQTSTLTLISWAWLARPVQREFVERWRLHLRIYCRRSVAVKILGKFMSTFVTIVSILVFFTDGFDHGNMIYQHMTQS